jgi:hypothetical protein
MTTQNVTLKDRWNFIKDDPEGAIALLRLLKAGKGTSDDFDVMVDRIILSRVGAGIQKLEQPTLAQLEEEIMTLLGSESSPITLEQILAKLRSTRYFYKHELARSIWRLADEGKVVVESGRIRKRH